METAHQKNTLVVSVGAGYPQYPFIQALKERGYKVAAFGVGRNDERAVQLCDYFSYIDTKDAEKAIAWIESLPEPITAAGSYAGGKAITTLQKISNYFALPTSIPERLCVGMDKSSQQILYNEYGLSSIQTYTLEDILQSGTEMDHRQFIVKPRIGRGSSDVYQWNGAKLKQKIQSGEITADDIIQEFRQGTEYRLLAIINHREVKLVAPIQRKSFRDTFFLGRLSYMNNEENQKRIEQYMKESATSLGLNHCIIKADIIVSDKTIDMIEMDIGVGGGHYYKTYVGELYGYDLVDDYIQLIHGKTISKKEINYSSKVMDYVYNLQGVPIHYSAETTSRLLTEFLGPHKIIKNFLNPEKTGSFNSNADFVFGIIHENTEVSNDEVNEFVNEMIFRKDPSNNED